MNKVIGANSYANYTPGFTNIKTYLYRFGNGFYLTVENTSTSEVTHTIFAAITYLNN